MHYFAIVLLPPDTAHDAITASVADALAPFSEANDLVGPLDNDGEEAPGLHWWDWYRIGGRWDGKVRGVDRYDGCASCAVDPDACHYSDEHEQLAHNAIQVLDMGECRPFTLVTPAGAVSHREHYVPGPGEHTPSWPWHREENAAHDRFVGETLLANRDAIAVGVDYHS